MSQPPTGIVTFLFTDIEGSTALWERFPEAMKVALARHDAILRQSVEAHGGYVVKMRGDGVHAAFGDAGDALAAMLAAQRAMSAEPWGETGPLLVRAALHTGVVEERDGDYFGSPVNRAARLQSAGHGGQNLLSLATQELVRDRLPAGIGLRDLGKRRLKDLVEPEQVFQVLAPDLPADFPPLNTLEARPNNLPAQPTALIGRESEIQSIRGLLRSKVRLVTLLGPGGTGKTHLGLQIAADLIDEFEGGVFFVNLAPIEDHKLVISTIAQTLGIREDGRRPLTTILPEYLREKQMLLLLDNFEQVVDAAPLVSQFLAACPHLKMLVTSRVKLNVRGESPFLVEPLPLPNSKRMSSTSVDLVSAASQFAAVELFVERARSVKPDFTLSSENALAVCEICSRVDGLPLAIELVAARCNVLSPKAILERLSSRLGLITGGARDLPDRQRTLRATIDWGHHLLDARERALFARLAVFVGMCTWDDVDRVCAHVSEGAAPESTLDDLASLVDKSLLRRTVDENDEPRFVMLETVREYALERLEESGEGEEIRRRLADHLVVLTETAEPLLKGKDQSKWLNRLEGEHDNLRAVLQWSVEKGEIEHGLRAAGAAWRFWYLHGHLSEGRAWLSRLSKMAQGGVADIGQQAKVINGLGTLAYAQGDIDEASAAYEQALAIRRQQGDKQGIAAMLNNLGRIAEAKCDYPRAVRLYEESLVFKREIGDKWSIANSLNNLGIVISNQGDNEPAHAIFKESLALFRELGDKHSLSLPLSNLGGIESNYRGDYINAGSCFEECLANARELGDKPGLAIALVNLGFVVVMQGEYVRATALLDECLEVYQELGDEMGVAQALAVIGTSARRQGDLKRATDLFFESLTRQRGAGRKDTMIPCLEGLADIAGAQGQAERAVRLYSAVEVTREAIHHPMAPSALAEYSRMLTSLRVQLGEAAYETLWGQGRAMTFEETVAYAFEVRP